MNEKAKTTGIVRRIDDLGRVSIPKEIRKTLHICEGDPLELYITSDELTLKRYRPDITADTYLDELSDIVALEMEHIDREVRNDLNNKLRELRSAFKATCDIPANSQKS